MMPLPAGVWTSGAVLLPAFAALLLTLSCSQLVYQPGAVVPTASPLPYSAMVRLTEIEAYQVEPGATMVADPRIDQSAEVGEELLVLVHGVHRADRFA